MKKFHPFLIPIFLFFLVILLYLPTLNHGFVSDDIGGIVKTAVTWTFPSVAVTKTVIHAQMLVWYVLYKLFGVVPWAFRLANILAHAVSVVLVYAIVFRLSSLFSLARTYPEQSRRIAFLASLLFAIHPIIIESVTWISGGIYAQYGMLFLLSFWLYLKGRGQRTEDRKGEMKYPLSVVSLLFSYGVFLLSCLFSEKAFVLFLIFPLYEFCFGNLKKHWVNLMPYVILSICFIALYAVQIPGRVSGVVGTASTNDSGWYNPILQLPVAVTSYFQLIFWPSNLTLYHEAFFSTTSYVIRAIVFILYCIGIGITVRKNRFLFFWLVWFLIPLLPVLTPLKIAWLAAERYAYLSVIGIFVCIAYWFERVVHYLINRTGGPGRGAPTKGSPCGYSWEKTRDRTRLLLCFFIIFYVMIFIALVARTVIRNKDWASEDTLWVATAQTSPLIPYTWNNMGDVYSRHGDLEKAAESFQRAITLNPQYADAYHNLGETYRDMGETGDAILMYEKALSFNPNLWQSHASLAEIYYQKKDYQTTLFHIEEALKIVPDSQALLKAREQLKILQE